MPVGRKTCPSCNESVGARRVKCLCGHVFDITPRYIKERKAKRERKPATDSPKPDNSGKKQCPSCEEMVGIKSSMCKECGHIFNEKVAEQVKTRKEASEMRAPKQYKKEKLLVDNDDGNDSFSLKIAPPPAQRIDFPPPSTSNDPELIPAGILEHFEVKSIMRSMIQQNKGTQASYGSSHVKSVELFIEYLAQHGYFFIRMKSRNDLATSINNARKEWADLRKKYGIDKEEGEKHSPFTRHKHNIYKVANNGE